MRYGTGSIATVIATAALVMAAGAEGSERGKGLKDCGPLVPSAPKSGHVKVSGVKCGAGEKVIKRFFKGLDEIGDTADVSGFHCTSRYSGGSHFILSCVDGNRMARYRGYVSGE